MFDGSDISFGTYKIRDVSQMSIIGLDFYYTHFRYITISDVLLCANLRFIVLYFLQERNKQSMFIPSLKICLHKNT